MPAVFSGLDFRSQKDQILTMSSAMSPVIGGTIAPRIHFDEAITVPEPCKSWNRYVCRMGGHLLIIAKSEKDIPWLQYGTIEDGRTSVE